MSDITDLTGEVAEMVVGRRCDRCRTEVYEGYCMCARDRRYACVADEITTWLTKVLAIEGDDVDQYALTRLALSASRSALARAQRHAALGTRPASSPDHPGDTMADDERRGFEAQFGLDPLSSTKPVKWQPPTIKEASHYPL